MRARLYNISIKCMLAILSVGLIVSCKDDDEDYGYSSVVGNIIDFFPLQEGFQKPVTRAGVIDPESYNLDKIDKIGVLSMKKGATGGWTTVFQNDNTPLEVLPLFNNGFTSNGQIWNYYTNKAAWEEGYQYKFRAYFPLEFNTSAGETCANGFTHDAISGGTTKLTLTDYQSASDPRQNTDLLVSDLRVRNYPADGDTAVSLKMNHLLACVNFNFRGPEGKEVHVTDFSIAGYADRGSCIYENEAKWSTQGTSGSVSVIKVSVEFNGNTGTAELTGGSRVVFRDDRNDMEIPYPVFFDHDGSGQASNAYRSINPRYTYGSYTSINGGGTGSNAGHFYIEMEVVESDPLVTQTGTSTSVSIQSCDNLLFIPQPVQPYQETNIDMEITLKRVDWGNQVSTTTVPGASVKTGMYAQVSYYFDNETNDVKTATIADLTGNGKITEWEAGKKYNYTVGLYEYQATANITIEDWKSHTYEEELK